eukprot:CAMPEP_0177600506 /NCGR_PEP_ID=MMETSP0419_2-20121207/13669_1 /TAXON_ID=582737 /ORGANISM="Tetraselmis sp., Strain GSL018" /LENGTH=52 /DNA_ID=CAMNT_0019093523 /DNA_START=12 /DNA_END=167 /DNA_ORIENTATION=+
MTELAEDTDSGAGRDPLGEPSAVPPPPCPFGSHHKGLPSRRPQGLHVVLHGE